MMQRDLPATVAKPLSHILSRCLGKQPAQRYTSAAALAKDLRAFADGAQPEAARAHSRSRRLHLVLATAACALSGLAFTQKAQHAPIEGRAATLPPEVTRNLVELARQGDEAQFARELSRVMRQE